MQLQLSGATAWVSIGGRELETYGIESSPDGKSISGWIVSEEGKEFAVNCICPPGFPSNAGSVCLDGTLSQSYALKPKVNPVHKLHCAYTSSTTIRFFMFSKIVLSDDDTLLGSLNKATDIGTIKLELRRAEFYGETPFQKESVQPDGQLHERVHERSKKAGVHCVRLGNEVQHVTMNTQSCRYLDREPYATFVFKYRPLELLRANGIVPNDKKRRAISSPTPDIKDDAAEEGDEEQEAKDQERIKALEAELQQLRGRLAGPAKKRVKVEPITRGIFIKGEIIDLT